MIDISDEAFEQLVADAIDSLPKQYIRNLHNVAITYADEPTPEQRQKQKLRPYETLFGLYEGIPQTARGAGYGLVLPDKITIFKLPLLRASHDYNDFRQHVRHTLWHEIAHHYGLDHDRIEELEHRSNRQS